MSINQPQGPFGVPVNPGPQKSGMGLFIGCVIGSIVLGLVIGLIIGHSFGAVSYTHLDVYKRQKPISMKRAGVCWIRLFL